jgi:hypothetical protein
VEKSENRKSTSKVGEIRRKAGILDKPVFAWHRISA